jgi:hypothetical protein
VGSRITVIRIGIEIGPQKLCWVDAIFHMTELNKRFNDAYACLLACSLALRSSKDLDLLNDGCPFFSILSLLFLNIQIFYGVRLLASRPTPASLEDLEFSVGVYSLSCEAPVFRRWSFAFTLSPSATSKDSLPGSHAWGNSPVDVGVGFAGSAD